MLASAYRRSLQVAAQHGLRGISFPSISTGAFAYPIRLAAPVALRAIVEFLEQEQHGLNEVRMVLYTRENEKAFVVFAEEFQRLLAARVTGEADRPAAPEDRDRIRE